MNAVMRSLTAKIVLIALFVTVALPASAQPLADRIPQDALIYIGWAGANHMPPGYAQSHAKAVLDGGEIAKLFEESVPRMFRKLGGDGRKIDGFATAVAALAGPVWRHPSALYWAGLDANGNVPVPKFALLVDAGDEGKALAEALRPLIAGAPAQIDARVEEENGLVIFAMGPSEVSAKKKPAVPLAQRKEFRRAMDQLGKDPAAAFYFDPEGVIDQADQLVGNFAPPEIKERWTIIKDAFGLHGFKRVAWAGSFEDKMWVSAAFVEAPEPRVGVNKVFFEAPPLSPGILAAIPQTSSMAWAGHLDLGIAFSEARAITRKLDDFAATEFEGRLVDFKAATGIDLQTDLADALGSEWAAYSNPAATGEGILGLVIVNHLRDSAKAEKSLSKLETELNALLKEQNRNRPPHVAMRIIKSGDLSIHTLSVPGASPAWAIKDGNLYIGLYPQSVAAAAEHVTAKGKSITDNADFAALQKKLGKDQPTSIHFVDLPRITKSSYTELLMLVRSALGPADLLGAQSPALTMPTIEKLMPHLTPGAGVAWVDKDGWHCKSLSPMPASGLFVAGSLGPIVAGAEAALAWSTIPEISRARANAGRAQSGNNLRAIGQSMFLYANENKGNFPASFGDLIRTQDVSPSVFVIPKGSTPLPPPGTDRDKIAEWATRSSDYVYLGAGKKTTAGPDVVLAHEKFEVSGGDVYVLFADGHVERLPVSRAKELIERRADGIGL